MLLFQQDHNMRQNQTTSPPQLQSDVYIHHNMNMAAIPLTVIGYVLFPPCLSSNENVVEIGRIRRYKTVIEI